MRRSRHDNREGSARDLRQEILDELSGFRETPFAFWNQQQYEAARRDDERHPERYPLGLEMERRLNDVFDVYYLFEGEEEPPELPPNTALQVIPDHYLDPEIVAFFQHEGPKPPPEVWVRGKGALQTKGRLAYKKKRLEEHGVTLENRIRRNPSISEKGFICHVPFPRFESDH